MYIYNTFLIILIRFFHGCNKNNTLIITAVKNNIIPN